MASMHRGEFSRVFFRFRSYLEGLQIESMFCTGWGRWGRIMAIYNLITAYGVGQLGQKSNMIT